MNVLNRSNRLAERLKAAMQSRGHDIFLAAVTIGVSRNLLTRLCNGTSTLFSPQIATAERRAVAGYLGVPVATALLLSGDLQPGDFFPASTVVGELETAYRVMVDDPEWAGVAPTRDEWEAQPFTSKIFMILLFERAAGVRLLTKAEVDCIELEENNHE